MSDLTAMFAWPREREPFDEMPDDLMRWEEGVVWDSRNAENERDMSAWEREQNGREDEAITKALRRVVPEKLKAHFRRAADPSGVVSPKFWQIWCAAWAWACAYCRARPASGGLVIEHVIPVARGGVTSPYNIVPACAACNRSKQIRTPQEWLTAERYDAFFDQCLDLGARLPCDLELFMQTKRREPRS
jgi:transcription elongation factor Elf1